MKISFGIIVIDGMPFIKHQLMLIYPYAHEIIICEGGDDVWEQLHGYRHSKDKTLASIKNFPDPENKICFLQKRWKRKNDMCHEYSRVASGDIIWHVDVDEFIDPRHVPYMVELFQRYPEYDAMAPRQIVLWGDTGTIIGAVDIENEHVVIEFPGIDRIYRRKEGLYINHLPLRGYFDPSEKRIIGAKLFPDELLCQRDIYNFHFSYVLPKSVKNKMKYYQQRTPGSTRPGWYENVFMRFSEKREEWIESQFDVGPIDTKNGYHFPFVLKPLHKSLPACFKDLEKDIIHEIGK